MAAAESRAAETETRAGGQARAADGAGQGPDSDFNLELSEDQRDVRDWVHGFAERVVRPAAAEWDEREETPWPVIQEAARIGLYGFEAIAQFWMDPSGLTMPLVNEELFWGDAGIGMSIMGTTLAVAAIYSAGTPDQLVEWVPQCFGTPEDPKVAAFCSSEPDAGSDVSAIRTSASYDAATDEWVLNGQKTWATNGGIAGVHVVIASVDRELGSRGHAAFVVPPDTAGLEQGAKVKKHGLRASHTADVHLDDCRVPGSCLLGGKEKLDERLARAREGQSSRGQAAMRTFEVSRPTVGSQAVGIARAAYEFALDYAKQRVQFGRPIVENQAIGFMLADMKMEIDAARLLVWRAAWMGRAEVEVTLALGATSTQAAAPIVRRSLRSGMITLVDSTKTTGLIFFPGTMVGMLLAGADPTDAVRLQLILLWTLLGSVALAALISISLAYRNFFTPAHQLREQPEP
jgi:acyl-CoA dehydrogenase